MTQRDAAFLGCRLLAVWFGIVGGIQLPFAISSRLAMQEALHGERPPTSFMQAFFETYTIVMPALQLVAAAVLFYGAGWLSRLLSADPDASAAAPSGKSLFGVGALLIGLFYAGDYVPRLFGSLYDRMTADPAPRPQAETVIPNIIGFGLAVGIVVWAILQSRKAESSDR